MSSTYALRKRLIDIARLDVGSRETTRNHGPAIGKFWPATNYRDGYDNREPYCAAGMCYWLREWLKDPEVLEAMKMTPAQANLWRCRSAAAFGWITWARSHRLRIFNDTPENVIHTGDIVVFDISHIGLVVDDSDGRIKTIEANTGKDGERDGDGVWEKDRRRRGIRSFIRVLT